MKKLYSNIRGTADFNPQETFTFNQVTQKAKDIFNLFGYQEIILPLLEEKNLFTKSVGQTTDIVERQMFKIEDKDIVLRPEGTAQVIRYYLQNSLHKKSDFYKFSYIGPMFRGERPQKGRLRQFYHLGVEAIGSKSIYLDAEIIVLCLSLLEAIGIENKELKLNTLGCAKDKEEFAKDLKRSLFDRKDQLCPDCRRRLDKNPLRVIDCKNKECKKVVFSLKLGDKHLCRNCKSDFNNLRSLLDSLLIDYTYSPYLVRGLDYYTNTVFEVVSKDLGSQDAIGAGGRYNNLIKSLGGPDIAAIGFALGLERVLLLLEQKDSESQIDVYLALADKELRLNAFTLLNKLRKEFLSADFDYCDKSLKAQLRVAQKKEAKFVVILGPQESKDNSVLVKDMKTSKQEKIKIDKLTDFLKLKLN